MQIIHTKETLGYKDKTQTSQAKIEEGACWEEITYHSADKPVTMGWTKIHPGKLHSEMA